jgi:hypothetical protein
VTVLTPGPENMPRVVQDGNSGVEDIEVVRTGPGVAVWRVNTSCKRNNSFVTSGMDRNTEQVWMYPQEGEGEYIAEPEDPDTYITRLEIHLPIEDRMDHWVVDTRYDKHGIWIIAFLMPTVGEMFTPEQVRVLRGQD